MKTSIRPPPPVLSDAGGVGSAGFSALGGGAVSGAPPPGLRGRWATYRGNQRADGVEESVGNWVVDGVSWKLQISGNIPL